MARLRRGPGALALGPLPQISPIPWLSEPAAAAWSLPPKAPGVVPGQNNTAWETIGSAPERHGAWCSMLAIGTKRATNAPGKRRSMSPTTETRDPWATLESRPLLYSREAVEKATTKVLKLIPAQ